MNFSYENIMKYTKRDCLNMKGGMSKGYFFCIDLRFVSNFE